MKRRCGDPGNKRWNDYGGRGIHVCDEWRASFEKFLRDMGPRPSDNHSLDRIDNDGNYEPVNVRWATREQQDRNKRNTRLVIHAGQSRTIGELAREHGINYYVFYARLKRCGWDADKALH